MKNNITTKLLTLLITIFILSACTVDVDWESKLNNIKLDQSLVVPIGETEITINDLLNKADTVEFLDYNAGNDIYFSITDSVDWDFQPVTVLGNVDYIQQSIPVQGFPIDNNGFMEIPATLQIPLGINNDLTKQRIDSSYINSAIMNMRVSAENLNINPSDVQISMNFPTNRLHFQYGTVNKIDYSPQHFNTEEEKSISAFKFFLPNVATTIPVNCIIKLHVGNTVINSQSKITFETKFKSMNHAYSYGYFPPDPTFINLIMGYVQQLDISKLIDIIDKFGSFRIAEPVINFEVKNYMGVKLKMDFVNLLAYKKNDPTFDTIYAQFNGSRERTELISPLPQIGSLPSVTKFVMSHEAENGDIDQFFNKAKLPDHFRFKININNARTESETRTNPDFITNRHRINVKFNLRFPLKFNAGSWVNIKDTIDNIKLDSLFSSDKIQKAVLVLRITNKLPIGCKIDATFLDEKNKALPITLITSTNIKAPLLDQNGSVIQDQIFEPSYFYVSFDNSQIASIRKIKRIAINVRMDKEDDNPINFQKNSGLKVNFGAFIQGNYNLGTTK